MAAVAVTAALPVKRVRGAATRAAAVWWCMLWCRWWCMRWSSAAAAAVVYVVVHAVVYAVVHAVVYAPAGGRNLHGGVCAGAV